jgi:uncharacterized protein (TIGR02099 family)
MSLTKKLLINSTSYFLVLATVISLCLVLLTIFGRQSAEKIDSKRDMIEELIEESSGLPVELGFLSAEWTGASPIIQIERLEVGSMATPSAVVINDARADLDIYQSLRHLALIWKNFSADRITINLQQDLAGSWKLKGFSGDDGGGIGNVMSAMVFSRLVELKTLNLRLHFNDGNKLNFLASELNFENEDDFHRAELAFNVEGQQQSSYMIIEGHGDPTDIETFDASGYLKIEGLRLDENILGGVTKTAPHVFKHALTTKAVVDSEVWFDVHPGGATDFQGNITIGGISDRSAPIRQLNRQDIKADITAWFTPGMNWGVRIQQLALFERNDSSMPINLQFSKYIDAGEKDFEIILDTIDVEDSVQIFRELVNDDHWISDMAQRLELGGRLRRLHFGMGVNGYFGAAELHEFRSLANGAMPGVRDLDAVVQLDGTQAIFNLNDKNGVKIHFARVYDEPLDLQSLQGRFNISATSSLSAFKIRSDLINAKLDAGTVNAMFSLRADMPLSDSAPDMNILIGGRNIDARFREKYFPKKTPAGLKTWLQKAIISADVDELGLAFRRGAPKYTPIAGTNQMSFKINDAAIDFHPKWNGAKNLMGGAILDDKYFLAEIDDGLVGAIDLIEADIEFDRTQGIGSRIRVEADMSSSLSDAMAVLSNSPLNTSMGPLVSWYYKGSQSSKLFLDIPVKKIQGKRTDVTDIAYIATIDLYDGEIHLPDSKIAVTEIFGDLVFESKRGLFAENVKGRFWGRPIRARFYTEEDYQIVDMESRIEPKKLNRLVDFPWHEVVEGNIPTRGLLRIPRQSAALNQQFVLELNSNLEGVEISLPEPFGKTPGQSMEANLAIIMDSQLKAISGNLAGDLNLDVRFREGLLDRGVVSYRRNVATPESGTFLFAGHLPTADLKMWEPFVQIFNINPANEIEDIAYSRDKQNRLEPSLDLTFDYLTPFNMRLNNVSVQIGWEEQGTNVSFQSDIADGDFFHFHSEGKLPQLKLSRLAMAKNWLPESESSVVMDPRGFPNLDISIDELFVEDELWGGIGFSLRSEISGAAFGDISGNIFGFNLGSNNQYPPAEFFWHFDGDTHSSRLVGPVRLTDVGEVFQSLNLPRIADSESGSVIFDLNWPDKPWGFSRDNLQGDFKFEFSSGSLYKSSPSADLALRMISLVNFANWLKRLQLDFSDVFDQNLPYDSLNGSFSFNSGKARLDEPLHMKMPSGKMTMAGEFDLANETMEGKLVATLPVATNLPWVAAIVGGLPAAAGVYLTSKLVEEQVDRLSSISYTIAGDWDDVEVRVDQIFAESLDAESSKGDMP